MKKTQNKNKIKAETKTMKPDPLERLIPVPPGFMSWKCVCVDPIRDSGISLPNLAKLEWPLALELEPKKQTKKKKKKIVMMLRNNKICFNYFPGLFSSGPFYFPHFLLKFQSIFLIFPRLIFFLDLFFSSFWPSGWATRPPGKALAPRGGGTRLWLGRGCAARTSGP